MNDNLIKVKGCLIIFLIFPHWHIHTSQPQSHRDYQHYKLQWWALCCNKLGWECIWSLYERQAWNTRRHYRISLASSLFHSASLASLPLPPQLFCLELQSSVAERSCSLKSDGTTARTKSISLSPDGQCYGWWVQCQSSIYSWDMGGAAGSIRIFYYCKIQWWSST